MTRGNQRELARAKNLKKQQEMGKKKGGESGEALKARKERDAAMMREKQKKAEEKQASGASGGTKKWTLCIRISQSIRTFQCYLKVLGSSLLKHSQNS